jgi:arsenate reductase
VPDPAIAAGRPFCRPFDYVITLCEAARTACPVFLGRHTTLHWEIADPSAVTGSEQERLAAFRQTRRELTNLLGAFMEEPRRIHQAVMTV